MRRHFSPVKRAINFRALRMSAALAFCGRWEFGVCGKRQGTCNELLSSYLGSIDSLNKDSG